MKTSHMNEPVKNRKFNQLYLDSDALFLIAEIGGNHEGDFNYAKKLLHDAISSGVGAVKFQIYKGDKIVSKVEGPDRNKHFKKFELKDEEYLELATIAKDNNVVFMASLWDQDSLDKFDEYIPYHKVGSGDLTNYPLIKSLAEKNKPLILSTAMADLAEVKDVINFLDRINPSLRKSNKICILHCVAMYGDPKNQYANLNSIRVLQDEFPDIHIGYSDHTIGTYACEIALGLGARVLEVHFTDDKSREFRDHHISITSDEVKYLKEKWETINALTGRYEKKPISEIETPDRIREFRRSVYLHSDTPAGTVISLDMITTLRPSTGIDARDYEKVLGKKLNHDMLANQVLKEEDLK